MDVNEALLKHIPKGTLYSKLIYVTGLESRLAQAPESVKLTDFFPENYDISCLTGKVEGQKLIKEIFAYHESNNTLMSAIRGDESVVESLRNSGFNLAVLFPDGKRKEFRHGKEDLPKLIDTTEFSTSLEQAMYLDKVIHNFYN